METKIDRDELAKQISGSMFNADDMQEALMTIHKDYEYSWLSADVETHTDKETLREQLYFIDMMIEQLNNKI